MHKHPCTTIHWVVTGTEGWYICDDLITEEAVVRSDDFDEGGYRGRGRRACPGSGRHHSNQIQCGSAPVTAQPKVL